MIDYRIFENSYFVALITFIALTVFFYIFDIGFTTQVINGKKEKVYTYRYQIAIALVVWLIWQFWLYPSTVEPVAAKQIGGHDLNLEMWR